MLRRVESIDRLQGSISRVIVVIFELLTLDHLRTGLSALVIPTKIRIPVLTLVFPSIGVQWSCTIDFTACVIEHRRRLNRFNLVVDE